MNANHCAGAAARGGRGTFVCVCVCVQLQLLWLPADNKKITNNSKSNGKIAITPTKINNAHTDTLTDTHTYTHTRS